MTTITALALILASAFSTPCASEDAANCVWIAAEQGNGSGTSFVDVNGTAYYMGE
jgi:hypothetical protein